jgi:hypothetical protein
VETSHWQTADRSLWSDRNLTGGDHQSFGHHGLYRGDRPADIAQEAASNSEKRAAALVDRAVRAEIKAMAADGFADPEDAAAFLDLSKYAKDGDIDTSAIKADLGDLLARKPHLGKTPISRPPAPNPAQGAGEASASALIAAAEASGDSATSIRLKNQQLLALQ